MRRRVPLLLGRLAAPTIAVALLASCFTNRQNEGQRLYAARCANCHGEQGQGLARLIPPLAGADYLAKHRAELPCLIRRGQQGRVVVNGIEYNSVMPGHNDLTDSQITNILNYVQSEWGNKQPRFTTHDVSELLRPCHGSDGR